MEAPDAPWRKSQHLLYDQIVSLTQLYQKGTLSMEKVIAQACDDREILASVTGLKDPSLAIFIDAIQDEQFDSFVIDIQK
jgi:hypothetical protein